MLSPLTCSDSQKFDTFYLFLSEYVCTSVLWCGKYGCKSILVFCFFFYFAPEKHATPGGSTDMVERIVLCVCERGRERAKNLFPSSIAPARGNGNCLTAIIPTFLYHLHFRMGDFIHSYLFTYRDPEPDPALCCCHTNTREIMWFSTGN